MNREKRYYLIDFRRLIAGVLLLVFSLYYINITLFSHYHVVDGVTIVHSHFHSEGHTDPDAAGHSKGELTLIQIISSFVAEAQFPFISLLFAALSGVWTFRDYLYSDSSYAVAAHPQLRAPPAEPIFS